jgi:transposase
LCTYPGIAQWTALAILAEIPEIELFDNVKQLTAYAGLNPSVRQSGTSVNGRGSISKKGSSQLRKALFMPTLSARRYNPKLKTFGDNLKARGKQKKLVIVACMRKMLEAIYWILKKQKPYEA